MTTMGEELPQFRLTCAIAETDRNFAQSPSPAGKLFGRVRGLPQLAQSL